MEHLKPAWECTIIVVTTIVRFSTEEDSLVTCWSITYTNFSYSFQKPIWKNDTKAEKLKQEVEEFLGTSGWALTVQLAADIPGVCLHGKLVEVPLTSPALHLSRVGVSYSGLAKCSVT